MKEKIDIDRILDFTDLSAFPDLNDKARECNYFLSLAAASINKDHFRWAISAFLTASYSYFEVLALKAFKDCELLAEGRYLINDCVLDVLNQFVTFKESTKKPMHLHKKIHCETMKRLKELRNQNAHHLPLRIRCDEAQFNPSMCNFGYMKDESDNVLVFCGKVMKIIDDIEAQVNQC